MVTWHLKANHHSKNNNNNDNNIWIDSELGGLGLQTSQGPLCDCKRSLSLYKYGLILGSISCDSCVYIQTSSTFYKRVFQCGVVMVLAQGSLRDALLRF